MTNETKIEEISDQDKLLSIAKDLVELAIQSQKVLSVSSVSYSGIEEARLLAVMTNQILDEYTLKEDESEE